MQLSEFDYKYPHELVAHHPLPERDASRMMVVDRVTGCIGHSSIREFPELLKFGDVLVINDTRVFPARLVGRKETGGRVEILLLKAVSAKGACPPVVWRRSASGGSGQRLAVSGTAARVWNCISDRTASLRAGTRIVFGNPPNPPLIKGGEGGLTGTILSRDGETLAIEFDKPELIESVGLPPLPPYIRRSSFPPSLKLRRAGVVSRSHPSPAPSPQRGEGTNDESRTTNDDKERYQTIYAKYTGSAAAPTAGFHFTERLLNEIRGVGVEIAPITLHVGLDTFSPVRVENIEQHKIHGEEYFITAKTAKAIAKAKEEGRRVIAVGTTTVRALESFVDCELRIANCGFKPIRNPQSEIRNITHLFIRPGHQFRVVDAMLTNFHQPRSTLLMLVSAFAGRELIFKAYQEAISKRYRLFSYGDAMFIANCGLRIAN